MRRGCRVLVLSPTRELASQIADSFRTYGRYLGIRVAVVFGGVGHAPQREALTRGVDVLVATPGRLLDHIGERNVVLDGVEIFVLDEADQMLDMGFIRPIRQIVAKLSTRRQSLFFSATMPKEIGHLAASFCAIPSRSLSRRRQPRWSACVSTFISWTPGPSARCSWSCSQIPS